MLERESIFFKSSKDEIAKLISEERTTLIKEVVNSLGIERNNQLFNDAVDYIFDNFSELISQASDKGLDRLSKTKNRIKYYKKFAEEFVNSQTLAQKNSFDDDTLDGQTEQTVGEKIENEASLKLTKDFDINYGSINYEDLITKIANIIPEENRRNRFLIILNGVMKEIERENLLKLISKEDGTPISHSRIGQIYSSAAKLIRRQREFRNFPETIEKLKFVIKNTNHNKEGKSSFYESVLLEYKENLRKKYMYHGAVAPPKLEEEFHYTCCFKNLSHRKGCFNKISEVKLKQIRQRLSNKLGIPEEILKKLEFGSLEKFE